MIYPTDEEGKYIIYEADRLRVYYYYQRVERIHTDLSTCPQVHFDTP